MMRRSFLFVLGWCLLTGYSVLGQGEISEKNYNDNSVRPIRRADIMYKNTVWLKMDLREKQNEPFFAAENQVTKVIIKAVKDGVLRPYLNDSLNHRMQMSQFKENLKLPGGDESIDDGFDDGGWGGGGGGGDDWGGGGGGGDWGGGGGGGGWGGEGDGGWGGGSEGGADAGGGGAPAATAAGADEFFPQQISTLRIREDLLFDRKRSRMYHDIQAITLIIPGEFYPAGIDKELATFSYKELVENVFMDNPNAIWYNPENMTEHRNLADAFDLRLFSARIIKFSNPRDNYIADIYSDMKMSLGKSQEYEYGLLEYESNLWSH